MSRFAWGWWAATAGVIVAASCSDEEDKPEPRICDPGTTQACMGPAQCEGAQRCLSDGTGWGPCECGTGGSGGGGLFGGSGGTSSGTSSGTPTAAAGGGQGGATGGHGGAGAQGGATGGHGGAGGQGCGSDAQVTTIQNITDSTSGSFIGPGNAVRLNGVVAMSRKFLVSKSASNNCLWGVFVSAPGLSVTAPHTGILAQSYGTLATVPDGGTEAYCPVIELGEAAGDAFPDDTAPGDVFDLIGVTEYWLLSSYCTGAGDASAPQRVLSQVCSANRSSQGGPVPTPADLTASMTELGDPDNTAFHDQWGGVKVRITGPPLSADGSGNQGDCGGGDETIVGDYGTITLNQGNGLQVGNKLFYQGLLRSLGYTCRSSPNRCTPTGTPYDFTRIDGFNYLHYCTWNLQPHDKCLDYAPLDDDCPCTNP